MPKPRRNRSIAFRASLQRAIHSQAAKLATIEQQRPATRAGAQARLNWQNQVAQLKARLAQSNADPKGWGRLPGTPAFYADSRLDELAAQKLRFHNP